MAKPVVTYAHTQSPFYRLASKRRLAELLGLDAAGLRRIAKYCQESGYKEWDRQSENGKTRRIESPKTEISSVQKRVAKLLSRITPPDFLYCPVGLVHYPVHRHQAATGIR